MSDAIDESGAAVEAPAEKQSETVAKESSKSKSDTPPIALIGVSLKACVAVAVLCSMMTGACMIMAYDHWMAQKFVSVDLKGYIAQVREDYLTGKIDANQLKSAWDQMESTVKTIPKNRVVIMGDAVIGGAPKIEIPMPKPVSSNQSAIPLPNIQK